MLTDSEIREKLVVREASALSDAELLSIVLGEGHGGMTAGELAEEMLKRSGGNLLRLSKSDLKTLRMTSGVGVKKAAILAAAFELGRRAAREEPASTPVSIATNDDVIGIFRPRLGDLEHEEFWVLFLTTANTVIDMRKVSQGGVSATVVDHKLIVKRAVEVLSSSVILVHNHPSGVAIPSDDDVSLTRKIVTAAGLFDIQVLDHIIITFSDSFSFRQSGII